MRSGEGKAALSDVMPIASGRRRGWFSRLIAQDDDAYAFLPVALEIVERPAPPLPRAIALTICAACTVGLIWASIGKVEIVANAPGVILPIGKAKIVQAVSTANIDAILVEDGQHVMAGQTLIRLDPVSAYASRDKLLADLRASRLDVAGLSALSERLDDPKPDVSFVVSAGADPVLARETLASIRARGADQAKKLASLSAQIAEKRAEIVEGQDTVEKLIADLPMLASVRDMYSQLNKEHLASRLNLMQSLQHYTDTEHDLEIQSAHRDEAIASVTDLRHQYEAQQATYAHAVLKDLAEARRKLAENEAAYRAAVHDVADTDLRAPVSGIVQQLSVHSIRGVVTAGDRLLVVVPDDRRLDVEAEISNRDIGFVSEGQQVQVKVAAFKFTRYGLVPGHVVSISRTSMADDLKTVDALNDPDGHGRTGKMAGAGTETDLDGGEGSGYVAQIALDRQNIETEAGEAQLRAGMAVTAGIVTGRRRVISYILSPVQKYAHNAGRER